MSRAENITGTARGRPFPPGTSGNPGGRPKGLAKVAREVVGEDGRAIASFWFDVMQNAENPLRLRLEASKLLAEHGWGKPRAVDVVVSAAASLGNHQHVKSEGAFEELMAELDPSGGGSVT